MPSDEEAEAGIGGPPGYCHFPEYGEEFFKQLTAEHQVTHTSARGFQFRVWEQIAGRENHWLDCRVYARAAAAVVGIDRFRESDWATLDRALEHLEERAAGAPPVEQPSSELESPDTAPPVVPRSPSPRPAKRRISKSSYVRRG